MLSSHNTCSGPSQFRSNGYPILLVIAILYNIMEIIVFSLSIIIIVDWLLLKTVQDTQYASIKSITVFGSLCRSILIQYWIATLKIISYIYMNTVNTAVNPKLLNSTLRCIDVCWRTDRGKHACSLSVTTYKKTTLFNTNLCTT